jgi:xylulokinase
VTTENGFTWIDASQLPRIAVWSQVDREGAALTGLREGMPVAVGCNDFYAALLGAGIEKPGQCFDITGTSEHFGVTLPAVVPTHLISSPFPGGAVHYGVTASSGVALSWSEGLFGSGEPTVSEHAPISLPYLRGERAPVFDENARGMFFGIDAGCDRDALRYSAMEGVVFSLYDIWHHLGQPQIDAVIATGGAAASPLLNRMKASLFAVPVLADAMTSGSAAGAVRMAGGTYEGERREYLPEPALGDRLRSRFEIYRQLYGVYKQVMDAGKEGTI